MKPINIAKSTSGQKSILVIDDTEAIRSLITSLFESEYHVITKNDGHEALIYLAEGHVPDLILLDMEMPNMNGRVFLRRVRYGDSTHNKIPIIFITSNNNDAMIKSMMKLNIDDYIIKPFKQDELIKKVHSTLPP